MGTKGGGNSCVRILITKGRNETGRWIDALYLRWLFFFFLGGGEVRITIDYYMCRERKGSSVLVLLKIYLIGDQVFF